MGGAAPVVCEFAVRLLLSAFGRENFARGEHLTCFCCGQESVAFRSLFLMWRAFAMILSRSMLKSYYVELSFCGLRACFKPFLHHDHDVLFG